MCECCNGGGIHFDIVTSRLTLLATIRLHLLDKDHTGTVLHFLVIYNDSKKDNKSVKSCSVMNVEQRQATVNSETRLTDLGHESAYTLLLCTLTTVIYFLQLCVSEKFNANCLYD